MPPKNSEFSYQCPKCGSDDVEVIEQEDITDEISGRITHFRRTLLCNECNYQWMKKHKVTESEKEKEEKEKEKTPKPAEEEPEEEVEEEEEEESEEEEEEDNIDDE